MARKDASNFTFEIKEHIAILSTSKTGWNREVNIVSWNGGAPKWDIRDWSPDHSKMGKGISFTGEEFKILQATLEAYDDPYIVEGQA